MRLASIVLATLSLALSASTGAAQSSPSCPGGAAAPFPFAAWSSGDSGAAALPADSPQLAVGEAVPLTLEPVATLRWAHAPERAPGPGTRGAVLELRIEAAGTYAIAVADAMWLDVVGQSGPQASVAHGHGPACSTIRKVVDFALQPGRYRIQLSGAQVERSRILVVRR